MSPTKYASIFRRAAALVLDLPFIIILYYFCDSVCIFLRDAWGTLFGTNISMYIIFIVVYFCAFECSSLKGTIGKMLIGIQVCKQNPNKKISFATALLRFFIKVLSLPILPIVVLLIIITKKHQGLHDLIAETVVINEQ
ncbi:MAG: RDD family protein [Candidatus Cloacimonetes bacterium]|nr:RDD family protein [Candidatus Cloacimonadota bacterium]